jgi:hypothetical protein
MNPKSIADEIIVAFAEDRRPIRVVDLAVQILREKSRTIQVADAQEIAERGLPRLISRLKAHVSKCADEGRHCRFEFTLEDSFEYIQGSRCIRPTDSDHLASAKHMRNHFSEYQKLLSDLNPWQFEATCVGVLELFGCKNPIITPRSNDQGIDFFGELSMTGRLDVKFHLPGPDRRLKAWIVGQAKHYRGAVSTLNLRELVGSVKLAQYGSFADERGLGSKLSIRLCDPVYYLFMTSGVLTRDTERLAESSGVIALDGDSLADILASAQVGVRNGSFTRTAAMDWVQSHLCQSGNAG